jgi:hypothetical protein
VVSIAYINSKGIDYKSYKLSSPNSSSILSTSTGLIEFYIKTNSSNPAVPAGVYLF